MTDFQIVLFSFGIIFLSVACFIQSRDIQRLERRDVDLLKLLSLAKEIADIDRAVQKEKWDILLNGLERGIGNKTKNDNIGRPASGLPS